ncbi:flagellar biosynthesis regulator FlaF [Rhodobacter ferrooxidans]|uniref:Flagellar FlaF family protein n=1 Tax=Rhodobacter ferrooxidans TaxID=371731 RepID=C8RX73_9RHOB|nr:flagellar biosynthesis regulator FlaF [Rhodobacter sp. SW2]EEW26598.1 flagellar FlaF family protein [Rhodobacter sp. SW2]
MTAALKMARSAYARPEAPARTLRGIEYDLLARTTHQLKESWTRRKEDFSGFATALNDNLRLWSALAADVAEPENGLPAPLRAQLFYLYEFTAEHSRKARQDQASVEVLVDINTAVMRGLRGEGGGS